jgi:cobalamin-dependent methionine synthase I
MKKTMAKETILEPKEIDIEVFETEDGIQFKTEEEALEHEKLSTIKIQSIESQIVNNEYIAQYTGNFRIVKFDSESQVEAYEQACCGNKDNNTWRSWVSCKDKFNKFPCCIVCNYIPCQSDDDYIAIYLTPEETIDDLNNVLNQLKSIK